MRLRPLAIGLALVAVGVLAAFGLRERLAPQPTATPLSVPDGDREIAWFHTSTNGASWEHFVAGTHRAQQSIPGLEVDDSRAFLEQTTAVPEVVLSWKDRPGKLRIRWYKLSSEASAKQWVDALADRDPPPLAIIGGGSSDRARDLAHDLEERKNWKGARPLLFITTATANEVVLEGQRESRLLTSVYPERSFRFCFTNEQMAKAVIDFVWTRPELRPRGGPPNAKGEEPSPVVFPVQWEDDPYSIDLSEQFRRAVTLKTGGHRVQPFISRPPYSVGSFDRVNKVEAEYARYILAELPMLPGHRSLLILPTSTTPARRFLRALAGESPLIGRNLIAVNGDAISINDVYRDGGMLWNPRDVPVPLVFFSHQNPIDWGADLPPPAGTDEVLLFADLVRVLATAARPDGNELTRDADSLRDNVRAQEIVRFDADGNRTEGDEYIIHVRPEISDSGRIGEHLDLDVWYRSKRGDWLQVGKTLEAPYAIRSVRRVGDNGP
jgi:hypothetical protein